MKDVSKLLKAVQKDLEKALKALDKGMKKAPKVAKAAKKITLFKGNGKADKAKTMIIKGVSCKDVAEKLDMAISYVYALKSDLKKAGMLA